MLEMVNINNYSCTYLHVTVGVTPKAIIKHNTALNVGIPETHIRKIKIKFTYPKQIYLNQQFLSQYTGQANGTHFDIWTKQP